MAKQNASNPDTEIAELVTKHVNNLDDKGKLQLPDDMPDWQKHVIRSEKRQRDAQSELGKTQAQLRSEQAEKSVLLDAASSIIPADFQLSEDEIRQLEEIKYKDPDTYRLRVNELESKAKSAQAEKLKELTTKASEDAANQHMAKSRTTVLAEFRDANPELVITDDVLANDVPPRLLAGANAGTYTYGEYLEKVKAYVGTGKKIPGADDKGPNLHSMPGSNTPGKGAAERQGNKDLQKITF